jgi:hypothetical protein
VLDVVAVSDFRPVLDIQLIQPQVARSMQHAIEQVANTVEQAFSSTPAPPGAR